MKTTTKGKVRPGLSLSSHQIRSRLRNRTVQKQNPGNEAYIQDDELIKIQRMNKVEREIAYRQNLKEIEETQKRMEETSNKIKQRQLEAKMEQLFKDRMEQKRKDDEANQKKQV